MGEKDWLRACMAACGEAEGEERRVDCGRLLSAGEGDGESRSLVKGLSLGSGHGPLRFATDMTDVFRWYV